MKCQKCKIDLSDSQAYEYRGAIACIDCLDEVSKQRDFERAEIIGRESAKTDCFRGLDLGDNVVGRANREILKGRIEAAGKESGRLKAYEGRNKP